MNERWKRWKRWKRWRWRDDEEDGDGDDEREGEEEETDTRIKKIASVALVSSSWVCVCHGPRSQRGERAAKLI